MVLFVDTDRSGLRLLLAARKSRKGEGTDAGSYARQNNARVIERAERDGDKVIHVVEDTISSHSLPLERKNLRAWLNDPAKLMLRDALYVTETDHLARMDDEGFHKIETWLYDNGKRLITSEGAQFPPRDWRGRRARAPTRRWCSRRWRSFSAGAGGIHAGYGYLHAPKGVYRRYLGR